METKNHQFHQGFLSENETLQVMEFVDRLSGANEATNRHLKFLVGKLNGSSHMFDISKTALTKQVTEYQSSGNLSSEPITPVISRLIDRISKVFSLPTDHVFLQAVDMNHGGKIDPHYDFVLDGHVNYKCNISVLSEDYEFAIDSTLIKVSQSDLYGFEASLYKHWTPTPFTGRRVLLSYGFLVPYSDLGRNEQDPRVRMAMRIKKYFQN